MAITSPFQLDELKRDWIVGVSPESFIRRVRLRIAKIEANYLPAQQHGVLIAERDPIRFASAYFAATFLGVPVILANPDWNSREWVALETQVSPAVIFGQTPCGHQNRARDETILKNGSVLIPTGGSSGKLKLAVHTWQTLSVAASKLEAITGQSKINSLCSLPLFHVSGLMQIMRSFVSGGQIAFVAADALKHGAIPKCTEGGWCLSLVPTQLQRLLKYKRAISLLQRAQVVFLGGAGASKDLLNDARQFGLPVVQCYGMTETAAMVAVVEIGRKCVGAKCLPGVQIDVLSETDKKVAPGEVGRIRIAADSLFLGYHSKPKLDMKKGFLSNDLGALDRHGRLVVHGRVDRIINTGGEKVDPAEIEKILLQSGACKAALAVGMPHDGWGEQAVVYYIAAPGKMLKQQLDGLLREQLVKYKVPKRWIAVDELPLDARGKLNRDLCQTLLNESDKTD